MDVFNSYGLAAGVVLSVLSSAFAFFNRERYKTLVTIYQQGNDELRSQRDDYEKEKISLEKSNAELEAKYNEQSRYVERLEALNLRPSSFTDLSKTISNNHKEMMMKLTDLTTAVVERSNRGRRNTSTKKP